MSLSGKNFESLNRFEKQAIASAAGISDMTEANKLFSMSLSAYDDMQASAEGASAEAAKLQERAQAATTFAQKLEQIGQAFAVGFMPVLEFAHGFANIILEINDMTGGAFIPRTIGNAIASTHVTVETPLLLFNHTLSSDATLGVMTHFWYDPVLDLRPNLLLTDGARGPGTPALRT